MDWIKHQIRRLDRFQQRRPPAAFAVAVWKKFGDDQAGSLAALVAYYAFASLFPLLLVLITILNVVLQHHEALKRRVLADVLHNFPVFSNYLPKHGMSGAGFALAIGVILTLLSGLGIASAMQNAANTVWAVPLARRPGFPWVLLRSAGLIVVIGIGQVVTLTLAGLAGGAGRAFSGAGAYVLATAVSLVVNVGVFWLAFRLATAAEVAGRDLWLAAILGAIVWQILQSVGAFIIRHNMQHTSQYGAVFGLVLGLLAWLYLQSQITIYILEVSVVRARRLWPRSLLPPPLTQQDRHAYELYAKAQQRRPEHDVEVKIPASDSEIVS